MSSTLRSPALTPRGSTPRSTPPALVARCGRRKANHPAAISTTIEATAIPTRVRLSRVPARRGGLFGATGGRRPDLGICDPTIVAVIEQAFRRSRASELVQCVACRRKRRIGGESETVAPGRFRPVAAARGHDAEVELCGGHLEAEIDHRLEVAGRGGHVVEAQRGLGEGGKRPRARRGGGGGRRSEAWARPECARGSEGASATARAKTPAAFFQSPARE